MKLISINTEHNIHNDTVLKFLKKEKADVICLQEFLEEDFSLYKKELNLLGVFQPWVYLKDKNHSGLIGKKQGNAIFAKNIIDSGSTFYVGKEGNMSKSFQEYISDEKFQKNRSFVWVKIKNNNGEIFKFITTQLSPTNNGEVTKYQLKVINLLLSHLDKQWEFVLCGDMNTPRGKKSFASFEKKYKDNIPLRYKTSIDQNLHRVNGIQFMVDCLFTTPTYKALNVKLVDGISDHMAIVANINKK